MSGTRTHTRGRAHRHARRRLGYWVLEVTGTALVTFTAAGSGAVAVNAPGWAQRLPPTGVAVLSATFVAALVQTRPRRWRRGVEQGV